MIFEANEDTINKHNTQESECICYTNADTYITDVTGYLKQQYFGGGTNLRYGIRLIYLTVFGGLSFILTIHKLTIALVHELRHDKIQDGFGHVNC